MLLRRKRVTELNHLANGIQRTQLLVGHGRAKLADEGLIFGHVALVRLRHFHSTSFPLRFNHSSAVS
jgi:hypothetical protein